MSISANPAPSRDAEQDMRGSIALDQWRGLALLMVLISHGFFYTNRVNGIGRVGVNLFFFISGILVFRSLSRTRAKSNAERTRSFWFRRLRRLYPALLSYSLAMLPVVWFFQNRTDLPPLSDVASYLKALPLALCYVINYVEEHPMSLGHLWSLACEMQFYLLAPLIYMAGGTRNHLTPALSPGGPVEREKGSAAQPMMGARVDAVIPLSRDWRRLAVFGAILVILMGLGFSHPFLARHVFHSEYGKYHFEFAVWPMMLGFCCEYKRDLFLRIPAKWVTILLYFSAVACAAILLVTPFIAEIKPLVVGTGALLLVPCLMAYLSGRPMPGVIGRIMRWLGERTYSIYLWQQPLTLCHLLPNMLHPVGSLVSVAIGGIWFHIFERPFLSINRHK
jgi:peptidoglycan/LPS O-acetylase OafA/YrhL